MIRTSHSQRVLPNEFVFLKATFGFQVKVFSIFAFGTIGFHKARSGYIRWWSLVCESGAIAQGSPTYVYALYSHPLNDFTRICYMLHTSPGYVFCVSLVLPTSADIEVSINN